MPTLITLAEAAAELGVPLGSLRSAAKERGYLVRLGRSLRIDRADLPDLFDHAATCRRRRPLSRLGNRHLLQPRRKLTVRNRLLRPPNGCSSPPGRRSRRERMPPEKPAEGPMRRFDPDKYYRPQDDAMRLIATVGTLAVWRHQGKEPPYLRLGNRIVYPGKDLNLFLDACRVEPTERPSASTRTPRLAGDMPSGEGRTPPHV